MSREIGAILGELRALHSLQADTKVQLHSIMRSKVELESHEDSLLLAITGRGQKIDRLLDEYARAMAERGKALT